MPLHHAYLSYESKICAAAFLSSNITDSQWKRVLQSSYYQLAKRVMQKITVTNDDGSTTDFFPQSYTDAAVAAVQTATGPNVQITDTGVTVTHSDGTSQDFVLAAEGAGNGESN
jgi:hypothetical protein